MLHISQHRCTVLLIILLLDVSAALSTNEEEFFNEPEDAKSLSKSMKEVAHKLRILADSPPSSSGLEFCVANPNADPNTLQDGLNWACSSAGSANCTAIQPGGACYQSNNLVALASYAYNDYYQKTKGAGGSCNFSNTAMLTPNDPSHGSCIFTGSLGTNTGSSNSSFISPPPPPPIFGGSPSNGSSPPFSLDNSSIELQILQMPHLILVFFYLCMLHQQQF